MTNIEMILKLMEPELDQHQLAKLKNVLDTILRTSRNTLPNDELIERFVQHKKIVGLKDTTLEAYTREVKMIGREINKPFTEITTADIKDYLSEAVVKKQVTATTVQTKLRCLSVFYDFLVNEDFMDKNPTDKIERIIVEKKIRKSFTNAELDALRNACDNKRDRALVEFLYSTGARLGEVVALNVRDINYNEGEVIVFGKGHKERRVYLSDECMKFLHDYLESRFAQPDDPLFMSNTDSKRISSRGIQEALRLIGMKAGVDNVHPHRFRRTMATHLLDRGMPVEQIKEVLGQERIDTTMIYCNVNSEKVKSSFKDAFNNYYRR